MVRLIFTMVIAATAAPAMAMASISVPEPGEFGLFALGVVGLIIGRSASRKR